VKLVSEAFAPRPSLSVVQSALDTNGHQRETAMAKGQKRSNREAKKPKKTPAEKAKSGAGTVYSQTWKTPTAPLPKQK
jgi:hypothetical protein